ncbi:MAG TPA: biotin/lipoyl-containing protein [Candidatus Eisenbacteria bacterium]|nr:biotin/lipoyl-containing protein [Candidatus Eisenbacteria bacterium]
MSTRYIVHTDTETHRVVVEPRPGGYRVLLGDVPVEVDAAKVGGTLQSLLIDGRSYEVAAMPSRDGLDVYVSGDVFHVRVVDELWARAEGQAHEATTGREEILSPMPGAVVGVRVAMGEEIVPGQSVAVVEAMKMQNDVASARSGRVIEIRVKSGDVVDQGAVLVVLGPHETTDA